MNEEPEIVLPSGPPVLPSSVPPPPLPPPTPWNGWMTLVWMFATMSAWLGAQTIVTIVWVLADMGMNGANFNEDELMALAFDGDFLGVATIVAAAAACPLCYWIGRWRRGFSGWDYLGLKKKPHPLSIILWSVATVAVGFAFNFVAPHFGVDETPEFMQEAVRSSNFIPFMVIGVVVGAPLVEEFIFRGVLFRGWRESKMGLWGTLVVTSLVWTLLHVGQYGPVILSYIFLLGMLMGFAREKTGNLWVPIAMHAVNNAIATFETIRLAG